MKHTSEYNLINFSFTQPSVATCLKVSRYSLKGAHGAEPNILWKNRRKIL